MSAVTFELPYNFVHTAHTVSQYGTSDEQQPRLDAATTEWCGMYPSAHTVPIGVVEATVARLMQEVRVFLGRNEQILDDSELMSANAILIGQPIDIVPIRMRVQDIGVGRSIATFDIDDLCQDDIDELF